MRLLLLDPSPENGAVAPDGALKKGTLGIAMLMLDALISKEDDPEKLKKLKLQKHEMRKDVLTRMGRDDLVKEIEECENQN